MLRGLQAAVILLGAWLLDARMGRRCPSPAPWRPLMEKAVLSLGLRVDLGLWVPRVKPTSPCLSQLEELREALPHPLNSDPGVLGFWSWASSVPLTTACLVAARLALSPRPGAGSGHMGPDCKETMVVLGSSSCLPEKASPQTAKKLVLGPWIASPIPFWQPLPLGSRNSCTSLPSPESSL